MFHALVNTLFGCSHKRTTFPISPRRSGNGAARGGAHVTCLDCGQEFSYDWKTMQVGLQVSERTSAAQPEVLRRTA